MIEEFKNLSVDEVEVLLNTPVWVTLLIAGADNKIDKREIEEAVSLTQLKQNRARQPLTDYYKEVNKSFESNLKGYVSLLPKDKELRNQILIENLEKLNNILPRLEASFAIQFYQSIRDFAEKIANASGGIMGFLTLGYEESKVVKLKMIKDPSIYS